MKNNQRFITVASFILTVAMGLTAGCKKKEKSDPQKTVYDIKAIGASGLGGTVTFTETTEVQTTIEFAVTGAAASAHPAHIHLYSALETGGIVIDLNPVDANGKSTTSVTRTNGNTSINYSQLVNYDGCIKIQESSLNPDVIIGYADIGGNVLTDTSKTYALEQAGGSGASGTAIFTERRNGNTLLTISLTGVLGGNLHPANIAMGSLINPGNGYIAITLNEVDATGAGATTVRKLDDGTAISYDELLTYDGYLVVHQDLPSGPGYNIIICRGNIGRNG